MSDFNRVILIGRIGNDPELKESSEGKKYLRLSLATHSFRGGEQKATHWHRVVVFGSQAEVCAAYLRKGSSVLIEGMLEVRTYTDKEDRKVTAVSVIANRVQFLGGRVSAAVESEGGQPEEDREGAEAVAASA